MFKNRTFWNKQNLISYNHGDPIKIYSAKRQRLEFVYLKFIKKFLRRKVIKKYFRFFKLKIWVHLYINIILAAKSKNARMGAGVGTVLRLSSLLWHGTIMFKLWHFNKMYLRKFNNNLRRKMPLTIIICYKN